MQDRAPPADPAGGARSAAAYPTAGPVLVPAVILRGGSTMAAPDDVVLPQQPSPPTNP